MYSRALVVFVHLGLLGLSHADTVLPTVNFYSYIFGNAEINLSHSGSVGSCIIRSPSGQEVNLSTGTMAGIQLQASTKFVSCRVLIGPLTEAMIGVWTLTEQFANGITRSQSVNVLWIDPNYPYSMREVIKHGREEYRQSIGSSLDVTLGREDGISEGCFIRTPDGALLLISEDINYPGITWASRPTSVSKCNINLGPIDNAMFGQWTLIGWLNLDGTRRELQKTVIISENNGVTVETVLEVLTYNGAEIDLNIGRGDLTGTCKLRAPNGQEYDLDVFESNVTIIGVELKERTRYVACRVIIGPLTEEHIGEWAIIERYSLTQREQIMILDYDNPSSPDHDYSFHSNFVPHIIKASPGTSYNVSVGRIDGMFQGCFITTPDFTSLYTYRRNYPNIAFTMANRIFSCVVQLGPVDTEMMDHWLLTSRYISRGRLTYIHQPILFISDDGIDELPRLREYTNTGASVDINFSNNGNTGSCRLTAPNGVQFLLTPGSTPMVGVTIHQSTSFVSCRVTIGPMTEQLLGEWILLEQNVNQRQRSQSVIIQWADPVNPTFSRHRVIAASISHTIDIGGEVSLSVGREEGFFEGCYLTIPDGTVIPVLEHTMYPGILLDGANQFQGCLVKIGPVTTNMIGSWLLTARYTNNIVRIESQQPLIIIEDDGITSLPSLVEFTHLGGFTEINLNQTGHEEPSSCSLRTPQGVEHNLENLNLNGVSVEGSSFFVACRVVIGPINDNLLGTWTLSQTIEGERERRQQKFISWADPQNPETDSRLILYGDEVTYELDEGGDTVSVRTNWTDGNFLGCVLFSPRGEHLPLLPNNGYAGITYGRPTSIAPCSVQLGPLMPEFEGRWILSALFENERMIIESQQRFRIQIGPQNHTRVGLIVFLSILGIFILGVVLMLSFKGSRTWAANSWTRFRYTFFR